MITVNNPAITIDKLLIAPSISPNSKAFDAFESEYRQHAGDVLCEPIEKVSPSNNLRFTSEYYR